MTIYYCSGCCDNVEILRGYDLVCPFCQKLLQEVKNEEMDKFEENNEEVEYAVSDSGF